MNINFKLSNQQVIYILIIILLLSLLFSCNNSSVVEGFEQDFKQGLFYLKTTGLDFQGNIQTSRGFTSEGYCLTAFRSSYSSNRTINNGYINKEYNRAYFTKNQDDCTIFRVKRINSTNEFTISIEKVCDKQKQYENNSDFKLENDGEKRWFLYVDTLDRNRTSKWTGLKKMTQDDANNDTLSRWTIEMGENNMAQVCANIQNNTGGNTGKYCLSSWVRHGAGIPIDSNSATLNEVAVYDLMQDGNDTTGPGNWRQLIRFEPVPVEEIYEVPEQYEVPEEYDQKLNQMEERLKKDDLLSVNNQYDKAYIFIQMNTKIKKKKVQVKL